MNTLDLNTLDSPSSKISASDILSAPSPDPSPRGAGVSKLSISSSESNESKSDERSLPSRLTKSISYMSEDHDDKMSIYSGDSFIVPMGRELNSYGDQAVIQSYDPTSLYILPDILNSPLPSVKETITSFERMITKKRTTPGGDGSVNVPVPTPTNNSNQMEQERQNNHNRRYNSHSHS